jgi:uncharacterized protein YdaU (DUF1376 family)
VSKPAAIPLFADAYLADTTHLTTEEHGAYLLLLMAAWRQGDCALPHDDRKLARIAGLTPRKWAAIKPTIMEFWQVENGRIYQLRLRKEHDFVCKKSEANRKAAEARWKPQEPENPKKGGMRPHSERNAPPPPPIEEEPDGSSPPAPQHTKMKDWPDLPDWLPVEPWNAFIAMRKRSKGGLPTARAIELILSKLERWRSTGQDPGKILDQSTENQWTRILELKDDKRGTGNFAAQSSGNSGDEFSRAARRWANLDDAEGASGELDGRPVQSGEGYRQSALAIPEAGHE